MAKGTRKPGRKTSRHHLVPRSRSTRKNKDLNNIVELDREFHNHWHRLFLNMTVAEVHRFIDQVMVPGGNWTSGRLHWLRDEIMDESITNSLGGEG